MMTTHMVQRSLSFILLAGIVSCSGDPTGDFANGVDHVQAIPTQLFITEGETVPVEITARDGAGNAVEANFSLGAVGAGITVEKDLTFEPVRNADGDLVPNPHPTRVKYLVTSTATTGDVSFVARAGGEEVTVAVRTIPTTLDVATLSSVAPTFGDTVTITAPAPYKFTPASVITIPGAASVKVSLSADSTSLRFLAGPNANGPISVSNTILSYSPASGPFTLTSTAEFVTPVIADLGAVNVTSATTGDTVTLTIAPGSGLRFQPNSVITFGGRPTIVRSRAADSLSIRVSPTVGSAAVASVTNIILAVLPQVPLTLPTSNTLVVAGSRYPGTDDPATAPAIVLPAVGDSIEFFDRWAPGIIDQFYLINVTSAGTYAFSTDWDGAADMDVLRCQSTNPDCTSAPGSLGATSAHPEVATVALGGTVASTGLQRVWVNLYAGAAPTWVRIKIKRTL